MKKGTKVRLMPNTMRSMEDLGKTDTELRKITGEVLGEDVFVEQYWTPVLWDDAEDPDFCKTFCLEEESSIIKPSDKKEDS